MKLDTVLYSKNILKTKTQNVHIFRKDVN